MGKDKLTKTKLYGFLKANSNIALQVPGCVKELDAWADEFVKEPTKRQEILEASTAFIEKIAEEEVCRSEVSISTKLT